MSDGLVGSILGSGWRGRQLMRKIDLQSVPCSFWSVILHSDFEMFFNYPSPTYGPRYANVSSFGRAHRIVLKAGAGADDELTHKVRIFRKCFNFLPWTILHFALSCTSRLVGTASFLFIRFICCLAVSLKFNSLAVFVVAVDGDGFNFNRYFSSSVYVVVDTKLFDPILPMCDKSSCLYQRISVPIVNYIYYGNYFFSICWIIL